MKLNKKKEIEKIIIKPDYTIRDVIKNLNKTGLKIAIVTDKNNCKDTTFNQLWVKDEYWLYIPNSFSPDLDGINDKFCINYHAIREETFTFNVFNRIGELIFSTSNIHDLDCDNGWDGNHKESGEEIPMGTYVYEIFFKDDEEWKHQDFGYINIIR